MTTQAEENNPETIAQRQAAEVAKLEAKHAQERREQDATHKMIAALPAGVPVPKVFWAFKRKPWVTFKPKNVADALAIMDKFQPVPFLKVKGTFLHIDPREWLDEKTIETADEEIECGPAVLHISGGEGYGPDAKITFWAKIGEQLARIALEIGSAYYDKQEYPADWRPRIEKIKDGHGRTIKTEIHPPVICGDLPTGRYWSSPGSYHYYYLWCGMEDSTFRNEMERFIPKAAP